MVRFDCSPSSNAGRRCWLLPAVAIGASIAVLGLFQPKAVATPITLQFETTVASIHGLPLGPTEVHAPLPFAIAEGDPLTGTFTYEPETGSGLYSQSGQLVFKIDGLELIANQFQIAVANDGFGGIDTPGRYADPGRTPVVDIAAFRADRITVTCANFGSGYCGTIAGNDEFRFTTQLLFEDSSNLQLLTSTDLPAEPALWNGFKHQELQIGFNNGFFAGDFIGAYIDTVQQVPEPSALLLTAGLTLLFIIWQVRRFGRLRLMAIALLIGVAAARIAVAETCRVELSDITANAHPDANYLQANFDFDTKFRSIESVSLELTMPTGFGSSSGTVEDTYDSFLRVLVHQIGFDLSPHPTGDPVIFGAPRLSLEDTQLAEQDYEQMPPNVAKTIEFHPYIKDCWSGCTIAPGQVIEYYWPQFFYSGRGAVTLQGYESFGYQFGNFDGIYSSMDYIRPPAVTQATPTIEATPTPETSSFGLLLIAVGVIAGYRFSSGRWWWSSLDLCGAVPPRRDLRKRKGELSFPGMNSRANIAARQGS